MPEGHGRRHFVVRLPAHEGIVEGLVLLGSVALGLPALLGPFEKPFTVPLDGVAGRREVGGHV
eukprot:COSAG02_NODE_156_length_33065_cov_17.208336_14_plen_63_part_00